MRVGIDGRYILGGRGIGNSTRWLVMAMCDQPNRPELFLYTTGHSPTLARQVKGCVQLAELRPTSYPLWEHFALPRAARHDHLDILHCTANTAPAYLPSSVRLVLTVHDAMYMLAAGEVPSQATFYQAVGRQYRRHMVPRSVRSAAAIITVSHQSKADIVRLLEATPDRVHVIAEAPGPEFQRMEAGSAARLLPREIDSRRPVILGLAGSDPRKNTVRLIEAFRALVERGYDHQLVLTGVTHGLRNRLERIVSLPTLRSSVHLLGFASQEVLVALYSSAQFVAYPSLYEGFGLPVLEAMSCGAPVITSNTSSLPEIAGDAALLISPTNTDELAEAMVNLASDEARRAELIDAGYGRVRNFSWQEAATRTLQLYEDVSRG